MGSRRRRGRTRKHPTSVRKVLVTGIPATGKTTLGDYLRDQHGFRHLNFETADLLRFLPDGFTLDRGRLREAEREGRNIVITWGFVPDTQFEAVLKIRGMGFRWVWFDGDRETALSKYLLHGRPREAWELQLAKIRSVIDPQLAKLAPMLLDPFTTSGEYRAIEEVANEVIEAASRH